MTVRSTMGSRALALLLVFSLVTCASVPPRRNTVDEVEHATFRWFWDYANPANGLVPDRAPSHSFSSIAAIGFGLNAYIIGADRGWVSRDDAAQRVLTTLKFFRDSEQSQSPTATGYRGFYYHFLDMDTGRRYKDVELSTIDTTLLIAGVLACTEYFDRSNDVESQIRSIGDALYRRIEWDWAVQRPPAICMGWTPEKGFMTYDWRGYNEAMIVYILALGSPTHPSPDGGFQEFAKTYRWVDFYGQHYVGFAPLFGYHYSHIWIDFRGIHDSLGIDYFDNSRKATIAQRAYAIDNPNHWAGYHANVWGLTASDGPGDFTKNGRTYHGYWARGATEGDVRDDGTIAPTAAISSMPFTPELSIHAMDAMRKLPGVYDDHGFRDAFNPTAGWVDPDALGIDQGPLIAMIENYRTGLIWRLMKKSPYVAVGLQRAGFK